MNETKNKKGINNTVAIVLCVIGILCGLSVLIINFIIDSVNINVFIPLVIVAFLSLILFVRIKDSKKG
jgi:hypothetical protein